MQLELADSFCFIMKMHDCGQWSSKCKEAMDTMTMPLKLFLANLSSGKERFKTCGLIAFCILLLHNGIRLTFEASCCCC